MAVELIEFIRPCKDEVNLYVTNISSVLDPDEIQMKLEEVFSMFGLVYEIQVFNPSEHAEEIHRTACNNRSMYYAFVKFYSPRAAANAKEKIHGKWFLGGQALKVQFAHRKKATDESCTLYMAKCRQLANFYLGFDGWSTSIVQIEAVNTEKDTQANAGFLFRCVVRLELKGHDCYCDGVGYGGERTKLQQEKDPLKKLELIGHAKKLAHRIAFENAFRRVIIISLSNGKVAVEINKTDIPGIEDLSDAGIVQINHIEELSCDESQENEPEERELNARQSQQENTVN